MRGRGRDFVVPRREAGVGGQPDVDGGVERRGLGAKCLALLTKTSRI